MLNNNAALPTIDIPSVIPLALGLETIPKEPESNSRHRLMTAEIKGDSRVDLHREPVEETPKFRAVPLHLLLLAKTSRVQEPLDLREAQVSLNEMNPSHFAEKPA